MNDKELQNKIEGLKSKSSPDSKSISSPSFSRLLTDLISGLIIGTFLGYNVDLFLETTPFLLFVCSILGITGGFYNSYKQIKRYEQLKNHKHDK